MAVFNMLRRHLFIVSMLWLPLEISCASQGAPGEQGLGGLPDEKAKIIASGGNWACAIREETNFLTCWGDSTNNKTKPGAFPQKVFVDIVSLGTNHGCARVVDGTFRCWGSDAAKAPDEIARFQVKSIVAGPSSTCLIKYPESTMFCWGKSTTNVPNDRKAIKVDAIAVGENHVCYITQGTGVVACWGDNSRGQTQTPNLAGFTADIIVAGIDHTCARNKRTGLATCWGGQDDATRDALQKVPSMLGGVQGLYAKDNYVCALPDEVSCKRNAGKYTCWGKDIGGTENRLKPPPRLANARVKAGAPGANFNCVILDPSGKIDCWGDDLQVKNRIPATLSVDGKGYCGRNDSKCIFVTSVFNNGYFSEPPAPNGILAADLKCSKLADAASLCGNSSCNFKAWMCGSLDPVGNPNALVAPATPGRMNKYDVPYKLVDGTTVAFKFADFLKVPTNVDKEIIIQFPIILDEYGNSQSYDIWTSVVPGGVCRPEVLNCLNWTSGAGPKGSTGRSNEITAKFTDNNIYLCNNSLRWYCVEQ